MRGPEGSGADRPIDQGEVDSEPQKHRAQNTDRAGQQVGCWYGGGMGGGVQYGGSLNEA